MLYGIPSTSIDDVWDEVRPWIAAACERSRGKFDADDIRIGLLERDDQLWIWRTDTAYAVGVTRLVNYPKQTVCALRIVTGRNMAEWIEPAMAGIEQWAKSQGCAAMELCARPGWERALRSRVSGYDKTHVYLERAL
jgi:hypothetical protein